MSRDYLYIHPAADRAVVWVCTASGGTHAFVGGVPQENGSVKCWYPDCPGRHFKEERQFDYEQSRAAAA